MKAELDGGTVASDVTVTFHALGGTADGGGTDYTATDPITGNATTTPNAVTITANTTEASTTINIDPAQDNIDEGTGETIVFDATLSGGISGTGMNKVTPGTFTITDNDTASTIIDLGFSPSSVNEGDTTATTVTVTATLRNLNNKTHANDLGGEPERRSLGGTATGGGTDYTLTGSLPSSVTIPAGTFTGSATTTFQIDPDQDTNSEPIETITLAQHATNTLAGFTVNPASMNLVDDDLPPLTLSSTTTTIDEDGGAKRVTVTATVTANTSESVDVPLTFDGGTAKPGTDFDVSNPTSVTVRIPSGQRTGDVTFTITPDDERHVDGDKSIIIGGSHNDYEVSTHTITLTDDDEASDAVAIRLTDASMNALTSLGEDTGETTVTVVAELNKGTLGSAVTVTFDALSGSADGGGVDYTAADVTTGSEKTTPDAITIAAGATEGSTEIKITLEDDNRDEGTGENIIFTATLTGGLTGNATPATLRINDNDTASTTVNLTVSPAVVGEDHSGEATVTVTATVTGQKTHNTDTAVPVRIVAVTSPTRGATPSTSTSSGDYTLKDFAGTSVSNVTLPISLGSITIPAGMLSASESFKIDPRDDSEFEGTESDANEYVRVGAGTVTGFTVNAVNLEITEDDNPSITISVDADPNTPEAQDSVPESAGARTMAVTLTLDHGARSGPTNVAISFAGEATRGQCSNSSNDYTATPLSVTIPANTATHTFNLPITVCDDRRTERVAQFPQTIIINGAATGFDVSGATVSIVDNDDASTSLSISASPSPLAESDGARTVTVKATLDGARWTPM